MAKIRRTYRTLDFRGIDRMTTEEVLEMFEISYSGLASRIARNSFPKPEVQGYNGKRAMYSADAVMLWALGRGFVVR